MVETVSSRYQLQVPCRRITDCSMTDTTLIRCRVVMNRFRLGQGFEWSERHAWQGHVRPRNEVGAGEEAANGGMMLVIVAEV